MRRLPYRTSQTMHGMGSAALNPKMGQPAETLAGCALPTMQDLAESDFKPIGLLIACGIFFRDTPRKVGPGQLGDRPVSVVQPGASQVGPTQIRSLQIGIP